MGERDLVRDALRRSLGQATVGEIRAELERRITSGEIVVVDAARPGQTDRSFTTREMLDCERDNNVRALAGQGRYNPIATGRDIDELRVGKTQLNDTQRRAIEELLTNRDQVTGLQGSAGAGKTTSLAEIREAAERSGAATRSRVWPRPPGLPRRSRKPESGPGRSSLTWRRVKRVLTGDDGYISWTSPAWQAPGR